MKGVQHSLRRALALLLSVMLTMSALGLPAYAEDCITVSAEEEGHDELVADGFFDVFSDRLSDESSDVFPDEGESHQEAMFDKEKPEDDELNLFTSGEEGFLLGEITLEEMEPEESEIALLQAEPAEEQTQQPSESVVLPEEEMMVADSYFYAITSWAELQAALNAGGTVTLTQDITAADGDSYLTVPSGVDATLNLAGFTLDRGLANKSALPHGNVLTVNGTLTINGSGTITGGNSEDAGGGVLVSAGGILTVNEGTITGNKAQEGGAIANTAGGTLFVNGGAFTNNTTNKYGGAGILNQGSMTMTGGVISGNFITAFGMNGAGIWTDSSLTLTGGFITDNTTQTGNGGGIYYNGGTLTVAGSPVISGNTAGGAPNNLFFSATNMLTVSGQLTDALIGVSARTAPTANTPWQFTTGLYGRGTGEHFFSDLDSYPVRMLGGEAHLTVLSTITVASSEHGTVTVDKAVAAKGETVTVTVTPDEGYGLGSLLGKKASGSQILFAVDETGSFTMPGEDIRIVPEFVKAKSIRTDAYYPFNGLQMARYGTLTADKESAIPGEIVTLTLVTDEGYGLKKGGLHVLSQDAKNEYELTVNPVDGKENTWTFQMPDEENTVFAYAQIEWKKGPPVVTRGYYPFFYIDKDCTAHGKVTTSPSIKIGSYADRVQISGHISRMTAMPNEGYVFKGWEVVAVDSSGNPRSEGYSLPVEMVNSHYEMEFGKYKSPYTFRIRAIFEEAAQPITLEVQYRDKTGTRNAGSRLMADTDRTYYAGDTITVTAFLVEGASFGTYIEPITKEERVSPYIFYTSRTEEDVMGHWRYIEPNWNGNTFSFTVPNDIDPTSAKIIVYANFMDVVYNVNVPDGWDEKIGAIWGDKTEAVNGETVTLTATVVANVIFDPESDLIVSYKNKEGQPQKVPVTLKSRRNSSYLIDYTWEFTMPASDVQVEANFTQKPYSIKTPSMLDMKPADGRPSMSLTMNGSPFPYYDTHVYLRMDEGDIIGLDMVSPISVEGGKPFCLQSIYYTKDRAGERVDLEFSRDAYANASCSFEMPADDITLHYDYAPASCIQHDERFAVDHVYQLAGEPVSVTVQDGEMYNTIIVSWLEDGKTKTAEYPMENSVTGTFVMPTAQSDVHVDLVWRKMPAFTTHSLVLRGLIGINFFLYLPGIDGVNYEDSYMEFRVSGKDGMSSTDAFDPQDRSESGEYYGFTCYVNSIQMADEITATFHYGKEKTITQTYSVAKYVEEFARIQDRFDEATRRVVDAIANYGHFMQPVLADANGWEIGRDHAQMPGSSSTLATQDNVAALKAAVAGHAFDWDANGTMVDEVTFDLTLDSATTLRVFFTLDSKCRHQAGGWALPGDHHRYPGTPSGTEVHDSRHCRWGILCPLIALDLYPCSTDFAGIPGK